MTTFSYETNFELDNEKAVSDWIERIITSEGFILGDVSYTFCNDGYLLRINQEHLDHDTYTDIISFDYSVGKVVHGDIYISVDRVKENAVEFEQNFPREVMRVVSHGILHFCGYNDKTEEEQQVMREKENHYIDILIAD